MSQLQQKNNKDSNKYYEFTLPLDQVEKTTSSIVRKAIAIYEKQIMQQRMKNRQEMLLKEIH